MTFVRTTAINKMLDLKKRIKGVQGSTSAGKTYGIIPIEIDYAAENPFTETSIVSESVPHLRRGAMRDFFKIMRQTGRWIPEHWKWTTSTYTFANGSYIEFFGADDEAKLRGARRDRLYMNEANNMPFNVYTQLVSRTKGSVFMDWNPTSSFWFHDELIDDDDVDFIILTYLDNEACPDSARDFILKAKAKASTSTFWKNWYRVYGLGLIGNLEGVVFPEWKSIDVVPDTARLLGYGMDFGYSNDPSTLIACYKHDDKTIFDEVIYQKGLLNSDIANLIKQQQRGVIYADSAEPKSIAEIRRYGIPIKATVKGRDSIMYGITLLQEKDFYITKRSTNLIKELRSYSWQIDKEGNKINKPIDAFNHGIDAMRYFAMMTFKNKKLHTRAKATSG